MFFTVHLFACARFIWFPRTLDTLRTRGYPTFAWSKFGCEPLFNLFADFVKFKLKKISHMQTQIATIITFWNRWASENGLKYSEYVFRLYSRTWANMEGVLKSSWRRHVFECLFFVIGYPWIGLGMCNPNTHLASFFKKVHRAPGACLICSHIIGLFRTCRCRRFLFLKIGGTRSKICVFLEVRPFFLRFRVGFGLMSRFRYRYFSPYLRHAENEVVLRGRVREGMLSPMVPS